jgi:hypothetical protein
MSSPAFSMAICVLFTLRQQYSSRAAEERDNHAAFNAPTQLP